MRFFFWICVLSAVGNIVYSSDGENLNQRLWDELALATGKSPPSEQSPVGEKEQSDKRDQVTTRKSAPKRPKLEVPGQPKRRLLRQR